MAQQEFDQIRQLAYRTFGLDLKSGKEELVSSRLRRLVRTGGFHSFQEYYRHVLGDSTGEALAGMIDALATNNTAFLREPDHFRFLCQHVLPTLASRPSLEIWSAACSTGEEVWTLAFLLNEALPARGVAHHGVRYLQQSIAVRRTRGVSGGPLCGLARVLVIALLPGRGRTTQDVPRQSQDS